MKKYFKILLCSLFLLMVPVKNYAQDYEIGYACLYDGYWGDWKNSSNYKIWGNYAGFIIYYSYEHPSNYFFSFQINSYAQPSKEEIKAHWKNNQPFVYYGTAEYYVSDSYPTAKDVLKAYGQPYIRPTATSSPIVKRTASAEIRIMPYKKHPQCYNIFFDNVGFAISLGSLYFPK